MRFLRTPSSLNLDPKKEAFPYQKEAVEAVKDLEYAAIFHEQGLGKTKIAIDLILYWIKNREIDTVLVVTKKQLIKNWDDEIKAHTNIRPSVLSSNRGANFYVMNSASRIMVTNFETVSADVDTFLLFLKTRNVAIVIDESTKLKNPNAVLSQNFFKLRELFKIRVIMTGTPIANRPYDIWSQIYFLDGGRSLGTDFKLFKSNNNLTNNLNDDPSKRLAFEESISSIFNKIKGFTVRETKNSGIIHLPAKEYKTISIDFEEDQLKMYNKIKEEMNILIQKGDSSFVDDSSEALKRLLRLVQVSSNPRLIDDTYNKISGKEKELDLLLMQIINKGEKVIVWSSFIDNIDYFYKKYACYNPAKIHGKLSIDLRNKSVDKFKYDNACKVLFATPQAAKEGLTLTVANNVIFYDRGFNLDDYLQAQDRIHRISQEKTCYIYNLKINGSIDEWIDILLEAKENAASLAQGDMTVDMFRKVVDYSFGEIIRQILCSTRKDGE